jgi:hypothetical protein
MINLQTELLHFEKYSFRVLTINRMEEALTMLSSIFTKDEPLTKAYSIKFP